MQLDCSSPGYFQGKWLCPVHTGRSGASMLSSSSLTFYPTSGSAIQGRHLKQQRPSSLIHSGRLYKPTTDFSHSDACSLLTELSMYWGVFSLPLIERNKFCYPVNLPHSQKGLWFILCCMEREQKYVLDWNALHLVEHSNNVCGCCLIQTRPKGENNNVRTAI